ncbi:unnamed protein product [Trichobilharzia regenti]|nr:unnamed protein product [Trichobilharzia regenti]
MKVFQLIVSVVGIGISLRLMFYLIEQINPTLKEKRECRKRAEAIFKSIGFNKMPSLNDYEVCIAVNLVDPNVLHTTWDSIGGLDSVIREIEECVLRPLHAGRSLQIDSKLLRPPKGILLYGPPGCGKTLLARAMARAAHANFINLQVSLDANILIFIKYKQKNLSTAYAPKIAQQKIM